MREAVHQIGEDLLEREALRLFATPPCREVFVKKDAAPRSVTKLVRREGIEPSTY